MNTDAGSGEHDAMPIFQPRTVRSYDADASRSRWRALPERCWCGPARIRSGRRAARAFFFLLFPCASDLPVAVVVSVMCGVVVGWWLGVGFVGSSAALLCLALLPRCIAGSGGISDCPGNRAQFDQEREFACLRAPPRPHVHINPTRFFGHLHSPEANSTFISPTLAQKFQL